jgi:hypothetical protein
VNALGPRYQHRDPKTIATEALAAARAADGPNGAVCDAVREALAADGIGVPAGRTLVAVCALLEDALRERR